MSTLEIRNPRSGALDATIVVTEPDAVIAHANALRAAQIDWARAPLSVRIDSLSAWAQGIAHERAALLDALTTDTGRRLISALEIDGVIRSIERWCRLAPELLTPEPERPASMPGVFIATERVPYALIGCISPWNFPLTLALIDAIPALLAGCAVIIKPSEVTPRFAQPLRASIERVPALHAVLRVIDGDARTGAALVDAVDAVCFTGSVATGRKVGVRCAERMIPAFLELGGKDPAIVLRSADLARAARTIVRASVSATGQACQSLERVYVDAAVHDAFVDELIVHARACTLNDGEIGRGQIGPIIFANQAGVLKAQLSDAVARGAQVRCGGEVTLKDGGFWLAPTVLTNVDHTMAVMNDETFGPLIPVMSFRSVDEAIALANFGEFGLSGAVFAGSESEARAVGSALEVGAVSINDAALTSLVHDAEKNAFKSSGIGGSRMGASGLQRFLRKRAILIQRGEPATMAMFEEANFRG
jgi:succinate-semialdehyde dehydrogenase / glutarate-semialdehyde dehydrogenase